MDINETLNEFVELFVEKDFRDRFLHEAKKRPRDLHTRICHRIEKIFGSKYIGGSVSYQPEDKCLVLSGSKIEETTWALAEQQMGMGGGLLVIDATGRKFYAETEAELRHPSKVYCGHS